MVKMQCGIRLVLCHGRCGYGMWHVPCATNSIQFTWLEFLETAKKPDGKLLEEVPGSTSLQGMLSFVSSILQFFRYIAQVQIEIFILTKKLNNPHTSHCSVLGLSGTPAGHCAFISPVKYYTKKRPLLDSIKYLVELLFCFWLDYTPPYTNQ